MKAPNRFVSIHNHDGFSSYDGLGLPSEHFEYAMSNGLDAHAITNHGHFNSYAHAQLWVEDWAKKHKGESFKFLPGIESYFIPSLDVWRKDRADAEQATHDKKLAKKLQAKEEAVQTKLIVTTDTDDETINVETNNQLTIEDEDETKNVRKVFNPVNRRHHLVLLPKNSTGLQELFHLTSRSFLESFFRFPRIDIQMLKETLTKGNVVASSACVGGLPSFNIFRTLQGKKFDELTPSLLDDKTTMEECVTAVGNAYEMMVDVFGRDDYFLELQFNRLGAQDVTNRALIEFARRNGLTDKLIVTCDAHYYNPEVWREREIYKKLGYMNYTSYSPDSLPKSKDDLKAELYPKNATQVWEEYQRSKERCSFYDDAHDQIVCDAIERAHDVAHKVIGEVKPDRSIKLPKKLVPVGTTPIAHLMKLCVQGLKKRGLKDRPEYVARLKYELDVIDKMNMPEYFITLAKILDLARDVVLLGPARGSGGGSLVNYVLYITELDPLRWDLPFERFMNLNRVGIPDIDTDVSNRDKVLDVMRKEFGHTNVVPISNYNLTKVKSLLKDLSKFYGIPFDEANRATATVEQEVRKAVTKHGDDKNLFVLTYEEALKYSPSFKEFMDKHPEVASSMTVLFKQNRSLGRHAGGVLVCDDLPKKMPLITSGGECQSPWTEGVSYKHLEKIGTFIKFDILGLETLRLIERAIELILIKQGNEHPTFADVRAWFEDKMSVDRIDLTDQKVYEYVYADARWCGTFQCTSVGAQRFFKKAKPASILDIAMLTSIYRPGPLAADVDKLYLEAKNEGKQYDWGDQRINELLKDTYGLLIFQEGVMMLAEKVAGFPKDKCDDVRRAIMKRSISGGDAAKAKVDEMKSEFVTGAVKNGYAEKVASDLYEKIAYFSGYAFNASHATAYAIDSYYCAWLLTHHEEEWVCSYLESMSNTPDNRAEAFGYVKNLGYQIVPIDVNHAGLGWVALPGKRLMPSMTSVKGVGDGAVAEVMQDRPYSGLEDFLYRDDGEWRHTKFNRKSMEALVRIGAFDSFNCVGDGKLFGSYRHMHHVLFGEHEETIVKKKKLKATELAKCVGLVSAHSVSGTVTRDVVVDEGEPFTLEKLETLLTYGHKEVEYSHTRTVDHAAILKKRSTDDPQAGRKALYELARSTRDAFPEWSRQELAQARVELFGAIDVETMFDPTLVKKLQDKGVRSIDDWDKKDLYWFAVAECVVKKTKNGKQYLDLQVVGPLGKNIKLKAWGYDGKREMSPFTLCLAEVDKNDFGCSTTCFKLKDLS